MGQANRTFCALLAAVIAGTFILAAAPVPLSEGIPVGAFATKAGTHFQPGAGDKIANTPQVTFCIRDQSRVGVKPERDGAPILMASLGDTFASLLSTLSGRAPGTGECSRSAPEAGVGSSSIEDCRALGKDKSCQRCCAALGYTKQVCGKVCHFIPHPGTPEPTP